MKTWLLILGLLVIGAVAGATLTFFQFPPVPILLADKETSPKGQNVGVGTIKPDPTVQGSDVASANEEKKQPQIKIDKETYDFGVMEDRKKGHHEFLLDNVGTAPLTLKVASTTCKCTKGEVEKKRLYPGEKTKMVLEWDPKGYTGDFEQTATLTTNDPDRPSINLKVKGRVHAPMALIPRTMNFGQITNREGAEGTVRLYFFKDKNVKIEGIDFLRKKTESSFTTSFEKLTPEEVKVQPDAKAGYRISVTLKPGMGQGAIRQVADIKTNSKKLGSLDLPIEGKVVGNISVYGAGWNDKRSVFQLGVIDGQQGLKKNLTIVVRNVDGQPDPLGIASVTPSGVLTASLSKPMTGSSGKISHAKLTIEIPPGTSATNYIGSKQAPFGHILLESKRPDGPKLDIRVSFVVEN